MKTPDTREAWLLAATAKLRPVFAELGKPLPAIVRVSCGFPSRTVRKTLGECWCSGDAAGNQQIFITPRIAEPVRVLDILVHELAHAALPPGAKHGRIFAKLATSLGLIGKPTATEAGPELAARLATLAGDIGVYPHAELVLANRGTQGTRLKKTYCPACGYTVRVTAKWLAVGAPLCPCNGEEMVTDD